MESGGPSILVSVELIGLRVRRKKGARVNRVRYGQLAVAVLVINRLIARCLLLAAGLVSPAALFLTVAFVAVGLLLAARLISLLVAPVAIRPFIPAVLIARDRVARNTANHAADHRAYDAVRREPANGGAADGAHDSSRIVTVPAALIGARHSNAAQPQKRRRNGR